MSATDSASSFPFGEQIAAGSITTKKFAGDERTSETELDQAWFRQYPFQLDRSMHPDAAGLAVDPTNPQSWSLYAYDVNQSFLEPLGLQTCTINIAVSNRTCPTQAESSLFS